MKLEVVIAGRSFGTKICLKAESSFGICKKPDVVIAGLLFGSCKKIEVVIAGPLFLNSIILLAVFGL
jgi:hypothetical protein